MKHIWFVRAALSAAAVAMFAVSIFAASDAGDWDLRKLDTARDVDYMSAVEKDVVLEMNKVRTDPKKYAEMYVKPQLQYYNGNHYSVPGQITVIMTEGASAVRECIDELSKAKGADPLKPEKGLYLAARDHAYDLAKTGNTGHDGSDGSMPADRIRRYCERGKGMSAAAENISYGKTTGRDIVLQFIIDDGVSSRGHRKNIMNDTYTHVGVSTGTHNEYKTSCVVDYAVNYTTIGTAAKSADQPAPPKQPAETAPVPRPQPRSAQTAELDKAITGKGGAVEILNRAITPGRSVAILTVGSEYPRLSEYIVDAVTAKFSGGGRYSLVDRKTIKAVADRKDMGVNADMARYIGKTAGAQTVIFGSVKPYGASGSAFRLEINALDVGGGRIIERFNRTLPREAVDAVIE